VRNPICEVELGARQHWLGVNESFDGLDLGDGRGPRWLEIMGCGLVHPAVLESAVVARPCPILGERVHAFVTLREPGVAADVLKAFCAERLSDYKVPESFTFSENPLPRNANGKLVKRALRDQVSALATADKGHAE